LPFIKLDMSIKSDRLLPDLLKNQELFLFVGAGLSIGAGLPGWGALVKQLTKDMDFSLPEKSIHVRAVHLLEGIEAFVDHYGFNALIRNMRLKLDTSNFIPTKVHLLLTELPIKEIYTTNYDDLIEKSFTAKSIRFNKIIRDEEIPYWDHQACQIVKLCGELDQPDSMIVTKTQFNSFTARRPQLLTHLKTTLVSKTPLFLGYSLRDPFLNQIWDTIGYEHGEHRRWGYAALFDCTPEMTRYFEKKNIHPVNLDAVPGTDRNDKLANWISGLLTTK
jgi:hypothetical protein